MPAIGIAAVVSVTAIVHEGSKMQWIGGADTVTIFSGAAERFTASVAAMARINVFMWRPVDLQLEVSQLDVSATAQPGDFGRKVLPELQRFELGHGIRGGEIGM